MDLVECEVQLIGRAVALAERAARAVLTKRDELTPDSWAGLTAMFLARAAQSATSAGILVLSGFNADALSVARTGLELRVDYEYIAQDRLPRMKLFNQYIHVTNWNLARAVDTLWEGDVDLEKKAVLERAFDETREERKLSGLNKRHHQRNWAGVGIGERAQAVGKHVSDLFNPQYVDMCNASHSCHASIQHVLVGRKDDPKIRFGPLPPQSKPASCAFGAMTGLIAAAIDACSLPEEFREALREMYRAQHAAYRASGFDIPD